MRCIVSWCDEKVERYKSTGMCSRHYQQHAKGDIHRTTRDPQRYITEGDVTRVITTGVTGIPNGEFLVDTKDVDLIKRHRWLLTSGLRSKYVSNGKVNLQNYLLKPDSGNVVDHINHITTDNRRSNLREATYSQNGANTRKRFGLSSDYKGVCYNKRRGNYEAYITLNGIREVLGKYSTQEEAAIVYNDRAKELFGEFALLNPVDKNVVPKRLTRTTPVVKMDLEGNDLERYVSQAEAVRCNEGIHQSSIYMCCIGKLEKSSGFKWRYDE